MPLCTWNSSYNLDVGIMDEHHRRLVELLNAAYDAIQLNDTHGMARIVAELLEYASYHFGTETGLMRQCAYPSQEAHQEQHSYFFRHISDLQSRLHAREPLHNLEIVIFLKEWLMQHILVTDRELAAHLAGDIPPAQGGTPPGRRSDFPSSHDAP
ncbi:bacteriohemerythrin [Geobacter sp. FeAm09]|uniref:bacteriohemerythrin n=1 Tax=Geobacter sp. FeAm09 TaxID=2597769 RepID=UPI0011F083F2|nr:bacteriohemerythrin [Geobacter sp. FeAm09]QEM67460.1 bacteriohemerythrin [Geobacter sp. FeAm09]